MRKKERERKRKIELSLSPFQNGGRFNRKRFSIPRLIFAATHAATETGPSSSLLSADLINIRASLFFDAKDLITFFSPSLLFSFFHIDS